MRPSVIFAILNFIFENIYKNLTKLNNHNKKLFTICEQFKKGKGIIIVTIIIIVVVIVISMGFWPSVRSRWLDI